MSSQPTLTHLFTMIAFAGFAVYAGNLFQSLEEDAVISGLYNTVLTIVAAYCGWAVAGPRIRRNLLLSVFSVLQGVIATVILGLCLSATAETFRLGYKTRYKDVGAALQGFFDHVSAGVKALFVVEMLVPIAVFCLVAGPCLSILRRLLEARRGIS